MEIGKAVCIRRLTGKTIRQLQDEGRMGPVHNEDMVAPHILKRFYSPLPMCEGCEYYRQGFVRAGMAGCNHDYRSYDYYDWKCYFSSSRGLVRNTGTNQYKPCPKLAKKTSPILKGGTKA